MQGSGLIRVRTMVPLTRRDVLAGSLAAALAAGLGNRAMAASSTSITFLGWQGYDDGLSANGYLKNNNIKLNTTYIGNNDEIVSKLTAGGVGQVDIVTPYMGYVPLLSASGLIDPIDESLVPNLQYVIDPFKNDPNVIVDGKRYAVPFTWGSSPMVYDPAATARPTSWADLLKPEYKGKVGMWDDPVGNMIIASIIAAKAEVPTRLTKDQLQAALDFLIHLKKTQVRLLAASAGDLADALARGDIVVTFGGWEAVKKFCADKGKKVELSYASEGTFGWLDNYCVAKDAPNRAIDHALCNEILSVKAQLIMGDTQLQGIVNREAIPQLKVSNSLYPYNDIPTYTKHARFLPFPPLDSNGPYASWNDWQEAYQKFKSA